MDAKKSPTDFITTQQPWFHGSVLYQIYPRSFNDSNGDGVGDLKGITQKLDYLKGKKTSLGVDAIWISPFYPSPMADFGYDVSNYCDIDPLFGTLKDFDQLITQAHARDLKVIIDFVPSHTSDQHSWFEESRSSKTSPKRDWYIWSDPKPDGSPPNNWLSTFGGSIWEFDTPTGQYYLHSFLKAQPDLNWSNPAVRKAMKQVMRFWFDRGVDGLRIDAVDRLSKNMAFPDAPLPTDYKYNKDPRFADLLHLHSLGGSNLFEYLHEMITVAKEYPDRFLISEAYPEERFGFDEYLSFFEKGDPSILSPFNFEGIFLPWDAQAFKRYFDGFQARLKPNYLPVYSMGNHDRSRIASRFGASAARTCAMLLLGLPGIPIVYYGDEIGMQDVHVPLSQAQDPFGESSRDPERTPMRWNSQQFAGFSSVEPWLPIGNQPNVNVEGELLDKKSLLNLYRELVVLRRSSRALQEGAYRPVESPHKDLFAFIREAGDERLEIVLNFSRKKRLDYPVQGKILLSTAGATNSEMPLEPLEGRIIKLA